MSKVICTTFCMIGGVSNGDRVVVAGDPAEEWATALDPRVRYLTMGAAGSVWSFDELTGRRSDYAIIGRTQRGEVLAISV